MRDPFKIEGPACISFSGGRTSGYLLWRILQAHGGRLPEDVRVLFANTGKEDPLTLDFVEECSQRWSVPITWVEYAGSFEGKKTDRIVTHATASRDGEPYEQLIREKKFLPNVRARFCTSELKVRPMHRVIRSFGWSDWDTAIGLRADEPARVTRVRNRPHGQETVHETMTMPLADAGVSKRDVGAFWQSQPFDLGLPNHDGKTLEGNCDLCFLKGAKQVLSLIRAKPERALWWIRAETIAQSSGVAIGDGARFRNDRPSYQQMYDMATQHGELFAFGDDAIEDCACTD